MCATSRLTSTRAMPLKMRTACAFRMLEQLAVANSHLVGEIGLAELRKIAVAHSVGLFSQSALRCHLETSRLDLEMALRKTANDVLRASWRDTLRVARNLWGSDAVDLARRLQ